MSIAYEEYMNWNQEGRSHFIGPSGVDDCYKKHAYFYMGAEPSEPSDTDAADLGTLFHLGWTTMIKSMFDPAERDADVRVDIEGMPRSGSADDVDYVNRIVTDLKTAKDRVWQSWMNSGSPYDSYWSQLELYALGLRQMHGGDWTMRILAFNRETGQRMEYTRPADPEVGQALVIKAAGRHNELMAAAAVTASVGDPLLLVGSFPREGRGPGRGMPCDWCPFMSLCWPEPTKDGGTPQSETIREDNEEIGAYAAEYLEAAAEASKAERRKYDAQAFLKGITGSFPDPNTGGTINITTAGGSRSQVVDCDAAAARLEELGEEVPKKWTSRASYPKVTRAKEKK